jgi:hypothetical protein
LKCGIGWNDTTGTSCAIGNVGWAGQFGLATDFHQLHTFGPAGNDAIQGKFNGLIALVGAVKFFAIGKGATVMDLDFVCGSRTGTLTVLKRSEHQA